MIIPFCSAEYKKIQSQISPTTCLEELLCFRNTLFFYLKYLLPCKIRLLRWFGVLNRHWWLKRNVGDKWVEFINFGGEIFMEGYAPQLCLPYCFYISMFYYVCVCMRVHDSRRDIVAHPSAEWWAVNRCNELPEWWLIPLICDNRLVHTATPKAATHTRSCTISVLVCLAAPL